SRDFQQKTVLPTQRRIAGLQKKRRLPMAWLGDARTGDPAGMRKQRGAPDRAAGEVPAGSRDQGLRGTILPEVVKRIVGLVAGLGGVDALRRSVDGRAADRTDVLRGYNDRIDAGFAIYSATPPAEGTITARARTLTSFG